MRALFLLLVACGGSSEPTPKRTGPAAQTIATPAAADDVIVAQVNGRPIYGSCVAAQARGKTKQAALDECIAFELMAQDAEARGLATDPDVVEATRAALVNREVELGFEARFRTPADLADIMKMHIDRNAHLLDIPEQRASAYVRLPASLKAPPEEDARQRATAEAILARLKDEVGLTPAHIRAVATEVAGKDKFQFGDVPYWARTGPVKVYADALFSIGEVGRVAPAVFRTKWGWDIVLLNGISPAKQYTREEAAAESFPEVRRGYFTVWADSVAKSLGVKVQKFDKAIGKLDDAKSPEPPK